MKLAQNLAISSSDMPPDMSTRFSSKPYFSNTPLKPRSQTKTGLCPSLRSCCAMPTQFSAGPKAASGNNTIVLPMHTLLPLNPSGSRPGRPASSATPCCPRASFADKGCPAASRATIGRGRFGTATCAITSWPRKAAPSTWPWIAAPSAFSVSAHALRPDRQRRRSIRPRQFGAGKRPRPGASKPLRATAPSMKFIRPMKSATKRLTGRS